MIGYIRVCRPGSVIGPQQNFVKEIQALMWHEGEVYRAAQGPIPPMPVWGPARAAAAAAATAAASASAAKVGALYRSGSSSSMSAVGMKPGAAKRVTGEAAVESSGGLLAAKGVSAGSIRPPQAPTRSQGGASAGGSASLSKSITDLSLTQLQERLHNVAISGGGRVSSAAAANATASGVSTYAQSYSFNGSSSGGGSMNIRPAASSTGAAAAAARATTPTRQSSNSIGSSSSKGPLTTGLMSGRPSTGQQLLARMSSGNHGSNMLYGIGSSSSSGAHEQAMSALLAGSSSTNSSSLRATLHTDTVSAANRPKAESVGVVSQSSDFISAGWRSGSAAAAPGVISASSGAAAGGGGSKSAAQSKVARILAPNGQPRKVPAAALLAANDPSRAGAGAGALNAYY